MTAPPTTNTSAFVPASASSASRAAKAASIWSDVRRSTKTILARSSRRRGQERSAILWDDADRSRFVEDLEGVVRDQRWLIHGYCLMTNHDHLLVESPLANLSVGMHLLNGRYSQACDLGHARKGQLFEDRFRAIVVEKEAYLLELRRYVVLNPVRASMVPSAGDVSGSGPRRRSRRRRSRGPSVRPVSSGSRTSSPWSPGSTASRPKS